MISKRLCSYLHKSGPCALQSVKDCPSIPRFSGAVASSSDPTRSAVEDGLLRCGPFGFRHERQGDIHVLHKRHSMARFHVVSPLFSLSLRLLDYFFQGSSKEPLLRDLPRSPLSWLGNRRGTSFSLISKRALQQASAGARCARSAQFRNPTVFFILSPQGRCRDFYKNHPTPLLLNVPPRFPYITTRGSHSPTNKTYRMTITTPPRASSPSSGFGTRAVHAGSEHDPSTYVSPPFFFFFFSSPILQLIVCSQRCRDPRHLPLDDLCANGRRPTGWRV